MTDRYAGLIVTLTDDMCPRCGREMFKVPVPAEPGDPSWVWGHDCEPD